MPIRKIEYNLKSSDRTTIRNEMIDLFKKEVPGTGRKDLSSKYIYEVESYLGYNILLKRPAPLNKGFDFIVSVETPDSLNIFPSKSGMRMLKNPSHSNISTILSDFSGLNEDIYIEIIRPLINSIYKGENVSFSNQEPIGYFRDRNNVQHPIEVILLAAKWLFIEQDITYWNWSGRAMLFSHLVDNGLI
ncbi:hypothetical protein G7061_08290 [Erysipelothrix sp. HDW6B]|uniref:hypothetical protein n=1 Tax=Erysipelothrix sp. HDW6B TaxID=2714929 RepID=UPI001407256C|nr:hypothetical protein [Erysipelothrix sp. HDW6B]QIK86606.1 hypothetical protein G7061_08290 [Erysipelothrix sp. HDW6B]